MSETSLKPLVLYRYHDGIISPNPMKVVIFLYELDLPWEMAILDRSDPDIRKKEPLVSLSPNGRMPILEDPNTGVHLWESAAIIDYLVEVYDKENKLTYTSVPQKYEQKTWQYFQMSGQGPYYGQASWFKFLEPGDPIPSAISRYEAEIKRILGVINTHLQSTGCPFLLGTAYSAADLMFVPWNILIGMVLLPPAFQDEWKTTFPHCWDWHQRLLQIESVEKAQKYTLGEAAKVQGIHTDAIEKNQGGTKA